MKSNVSISLFVLIFVLHAIPGWCDLGPFSLYVNKETGEASEFTGSRSYTSDCCESGSATITTEGPITVEVDPELAMGPNETKTWTGSIRPILADAPDAGTSAEASFTVNYDFSYWSLSGEPLPGRSGSEKVHFVIYGVKVDADENALVCPHGGQIQLSGAGWPEGGSYEWSSTDANVTLQNSNEQTCTAQIVGGNQSYTVQVKYTIEGVSATKNVIIKSFTLSVNVASDFICDGNGTEVTVTHAPADISRNQLVACLQNLKVVAMPSVASQGNPIGHTNMPIDPVDMTTWKTTIRNGIWYSNSGNGCNITSTYKLKAVAECACGAGNVESNETLLTISTSFGGCINGSATPGPPYFVGLPNITVSYQWGIIAPSGYTARIYAGSFRKHVNVNVVVAVNANSQYRGMVENEENYHALQFKGNTGIAPIAGMWNAANVIATADRLISGIVFPTENRAYAAAVSAFRIGLSRELARSVAIWNWNLRCQLEREAKTAISAAFRGAMPCAYPTCP